MTTTILFMHYNFIRVGYLFMTIKNLFNFKYFIKLFKINYFFINP